jgi:hypothetical protein
MVWPLKVQLCLACFGLSGRPQRRVPFLTEDSLFRPCNPALSQTRRVGAETRGSDSPPDHCMGPLASVQGRGALPTLHCPPLQGRGGLPFFDQRQPIQVSHSGGVTVVPGRDLKSCPHAQQPGRPRKTRDRDVQCELPMKGLVVQRANR